MSIKRLLATLDKPNLVPLIRNRTKGEETLTKLGERVLRNHNENIHSMNEWSTLIDAGMDVAKVEDKGASYPWDGAANYKSPLITEAVRQFGDRAKTEIMGSDKLVACKVQGIENEENNDSCDRIEKHMNWQINTEMPHWREVHTKLLYTVAGHGAVFKKTYYDSTMGCNVSRRIKYPNFSIHQECEYVEAGNFTEILYYYPNDVWERKSAGIWDVPVDLVPALDSEDAKTEDNFCFLEQCVCFDLDGDGYEEPVLVTVHKQSSTVVRIVPQYDVENIHVDYLGNTYNLRDLINSRATPQLPNTPENAQFNQEYVRRQLENIEKDSKLVRITPEKFITYYGFVESIDGSFLGLGYLHLLSTNVKGVNKTSNALLNAGELANLQGGWLSREHRDRKSGDYEVKPGNFKQTNITAVNLANSVFPLPFKEPSPTLLELNRELKVDIVNMSAKFNADAAMNSGVSAASVLGALQEGVIPTSSLIMNIVTAMSCEFSVMYRLNKMYTEPLVYEMLNGTQDFGADYRSDVGIKPTANAMFSNQMQRITLAQAQMEQMERFLQVGGNPIPIVKGYYEALGTPNMEELFPENMTTQEQQTQQRMLQVQQAQVEALQQQNSILQYQLQLAKIDTDRRVFEAQSKAQKDQADLQQKAVRLENEIVAMQQKMLREDVETQMKMRREVIELQRLRAEVLEKLARVDETVAKTMQIEQTLAAGDINAIQVLGDNDLLSFIGVEAQ